MAPRLPSSPVSPVLSEPGSENDGVFNSTKSRQDMKKSDTTKKSKTAKREAGEPDSRGTKRKRSESKSQRGRNNNSNGTENRKRVRPSTDSQRRESNKVEKSSTKKAESVTGRKQASATTSNDNISTTKKQSKKKGSERESKESQNSAAVETDDDEQETNSAAANASSQQQQQQQQPKRRKTKEENKNKKKLAEKAMTPLAQRSTGLKHFIGAHVSSAGGVQNAVKNALHIGGNAFAMFLKSQRKWANPPLSDEHSDSFRASCKSHSYESGGHVLPHGSYLVNLAHTDPSRTQQAYDGFIDDLGRCNSLGIKLYNFHPGNSASSSKEEAITHLAEQLNRAHQDPKSGKVITLLETMAGMGNVIGATFEDLKQIIDQVKDKERVGVCLDTCHVFAAGYDLCSPEAFRNTFDKFDNTIGLKYLKALHVNDSKAPLGSNRDLHANIGTGFLGLRAFHNLMNEKRLQGLPFILETPTDAKNADGKATDDKSIWAREIKLLESLVDMDVHNSDFTDMERKLAAQGTEERNKIDDQVKRKEQKAIAKSRKRKKGQKPNSQNNSSDKEESD